MPLAPRTSHHGFVLLGGGLFAAFVTLRLLLDRSAVKLHRLLKDNYSVLDKEEIEMAKRLIAAGHGAVLCGWARRGIRDVQKRQLVRAAAKKLTDVAPAVSTERLAVLKPPVALQKPHNLTAHGDSRYDPFYWLRDDARTDPEVLAYIHAENEYCKAALADTEPLQAELFKEVRGRVQETDESVAVLKGGYYYYKRTLEGKQYSIHCRRAVPEGAPSHDENYEMDTGVPEEVLLDENKEAEKFKFYQVGGMSISDDGRKLCYSEDTVGNELYTLHVIDLATRKSLLTAPIPSTSGTVLWAADNNTFFYIKRDSKMRPYQVYRQQLQADGEAECVFEESNESYLVSLGKTRDKKLVLLNSCAVMQNEIWYVSAETPMDDFKVMFERTTNVDVDVEHWGGSLLITKRTASTPNSEIFIAPLSDPAQQRLLLAHRQAVKIEDTSLSARHFAVLERNNGLSECCVFTLPPENAPEKVALEGGEKLKFEEPAYVLYFSSQGDYDTDVLALTYSSLATPSTWLAHNMVTHKRVVKKVMPVLEGFNVEDYTTERVWAPSHDGVKVPVSLVYNNKVVKARSVTALHLDAYGAYESCNEPYFSQERVSMLDRGIVYAIAHVRGGGELGRDWYETGKFLHKKNTFLDVVAAAEHLVSEGWTSSSQMTLEGASAGGMTVGAVANMRPDLFTGILMKVPFVDCLTTMLDDSIPLTVEEYDEWGNPNEENYYYYMKDYSPVDNIEAKEYPAMLITTGLHDPRVAYWEPAKFVAKLRLTKTDSNMLAFKCDLGSGHFAQSGRFDAMKERTIEYAFIIKCVGKL